MEDPLPLLRAVPAACPTSEVVELLIEPVELVPKLLDVLDVLRPESVLLDMLLELVV